MNDVQPAGRWGRRPTYAAKVGTFGSTVIVVKRARRFKVNQRIEFAELTDLDGMSVGCTPKWRHGLIWKIEGDRLFVNLH